MPLLPLEPFVYPEDLLTNPTAEPYGSWWAVHTRPRAEKAMARKLLDARVSFFLPLYRKEQRGTNRRLQRSYLPLFPGYLFVHGDDEARMAALKTNQVAQMLPVSDTRQLRADLERVWRIVEGGTGVYPEPYLEPGTAVRVVSGPLSGMEGVVLRRGRKLLFVIEVRFLQQGVSVEVPPEALLPLEGRRPAAS
jgi:transcription antitermination factor NusG